MGQVCKHLHKTGPEMEAPRKAKERLPMNYWCGDVEGEMK